MFKQLGYIGVILLFMIGMSQKISAQEPGWSPVPAQGFETELEYLEPYDKDRQIETLSINVLVPIQKDINDEHLTFYKGITLTRPWGSINRDTKSKFWYTFT